MIVIKPLGKMHRDIYLSNLRVASIADLQLFDALFAKPWQVYAKRPFCGTSQVVGKHPSKGFAAALSCSTDSNTLLRSGA